MQNLATATVQGLAALALVAGTATAQMSLPYSSRLGGKLVADDSGHVYVIRTTRPQFDPLPPTTDGTTAAVGELALWIAKLDTTLACVGSPSDPNNPSLCWGTLPIVTDGDIIQPRDIALGPNGDLYVTGWAMTSPGFGTPGAYDPDFDGGREVFVARFSGATGALIAWTYFGTTSGGNAAGHAIAFTPSGSVVVTGQTDREMPTTSTAFRQALYGGGDAWVAVFNANLSNDGGGPDGNGLIYASILPGGSGQEVGRAVAADASERLWVGGFTDSSDLDPALPGGPQGRTDGFVVSIDPLQGGIAWGTVLGGSQDDDVTGLATDGSGSVLACGTTLSDGLWQAGRSGRGDAFVAEFDASGALVGGRYLGGGQDDSAAGIGIDGAGHIVVAGSTISEDFPTTPNAYDSTHNSRRKDDVFVARLDASFGLTDGTFLGGSNVDTLGQGDLSLDSDGAAYLSGDPASSDFPTTVETAYQAGFVAKLTFESVPGITVDPSAGLVTTEAGNGEDSFTVVLNTAPLFPVMIGVMTSDLSEALVSSGAQGPTSLVTLTFDTSNWDQPQTVTATGQQDTEIDGDVAYTLVTLPSVSSDPLYDGLDAADVAAINVDDEAPPGIGVDGISPNSMDAGSSILVTVSGSGFRPGAAVTFENGQGPAPRAANVDVSSPTALTATVSVGGGGPAGTRTWDVRVTNTDGSTGVLQAGFSIVK